MDLKCREKTTAKKHIQYCEGGVGRIFLDACSNKYIFQVVSNLLRLPFNQSRDKRTNPLLMILKEPEPDPNPTLFTTFYFSRGIKASISYHKIDAIIIQAIHQSLCIHWFSPESEID